MKVGNVIGAIWATRKAACLQGQTFLVVEADGQTIVAADQVGAGTGDRVLLPPAPWHRSTAWTPRWMRQWWPLWTKNRIRRRERICPFTKYSLR